MPGGLQVENNKFKVYLPTGRDFLDLVTRALARIFRDQETTNISIPGIMSRAKFLRDRSPAPAAQLG